jgi:probable rRNA maturation factor
MSTITLDIKRTVKDTVRLPFEKIASAVLPRGYQLSLVICGDRLSQRMNAEYRNKTYRPNVLSFPLSKHEGEIFLNIRKAEREAKQEGISRDKRAALLFVHGCFHLAGYKHGEAMESRERGVLKKYNLI